MPFSEVGSHGLCNAIYMSAFDNPFIAKRSFHCSGVNATRNVPPHFRMGYSERRKWIQGVFFAPTYKDYPYNFEDFEGNNLIR